MGLAPIGGQLPQPFGLAVVGLSFFLHRLQVVEDLFLRQAGELGEVLDLDKTLDSKRVMNPEARRRVVCHMSHNTHLQSES